MLSQSTQASHAETLPQLVPLKKPLFRTSGVLCKQRTPSGRRMKSKSATTSSEERVKQINPDLMSHPLKGEVFCKQKTSLPEGIEHSLGWFSRWKPSSFWSFGQWETLK
jgi:hypothetical protein